MSPRPDLVAAAEVLRVWVHNQRATWPGRQTPSPIQAAAAAALLVRPQATPVSVTMLSGDQLPDLPFTMTVGTSRGLALVRRGATLLGTAAAPLVVLALVGFAGRSAWSKYVTHAQGTAVFESSPAGTEVLIDGLTAGMTPFRVPLSTGRHVVELRHKGATRAQALQIARNRESLVSVDWNLRPKGRLKVEADPKGAHVLVDGREVGRAPLTIPDIAVGSHTIVIETSEGSVRRKVEISEGLTEQLSESIFPGWVRIAAPVEVTVSERGRAIPLDDHNRAMLKPGVHQLQIDNTRFGFSEVHQVEVEPGATAIVDIDTPLSTLTITTSAPADITVDGARVGDAPILNLPVKLGTRNIVATDRLGTTQRATVTVISRPSTVEITFPKP